MNYELVAISICSRGEERNREDGERLAGHEGG